MNCVAEYQGDQSLQLKDKPLPEIQDYEVLIRVQTATICGTDLHILRGEYKSAPPVVLGHEYAGHIEKTGNKVASVREGDFVTVEPHLYCGICRFCRIGKEHLCDNKRAFGVHMDGGFAQYSVVSEENLYKVPHHLSALEASLTENVGCCLHGIEQANVKVGDRVIIIGGGFVGIVLSELSRLRGASDVLVFELNNEKRKILKNRGFKVENPKEVDVNEVSNEFTNGTGADIVMEAAGTPQTAKQCFDLIGKGGTILFFGVVPPSKEINIYPADINKREITVVGSAINPFSHYRSLKTLEKLDLDELVTHHYALSEINEAFDIFKTGQAIKVAIHPNGEKGE